MIANVLVELSNRNVDKTFSYNIPSELLDKVKVGIRVKVPFGKNYIEGFVLEITNSSNYEDLKSDLLEDLEVDKKKASLISKLCKLISIEELESLVKKYEKKGNSE